MVSVPWESARLIVPVEPRPWPEDRAERVSVNSYGMGGPNAHVSSETRLRSVCIANLCLSL